MQVAEHQDHEAEDAHDTPLEEESKRPSFVGAPPHAAVFPAKVRGDSRAAVFLPLLAAAIFGAIGEGSAAARSTGRSGSLIAFTAGLTAALLSAPVLILFASLFGFALTRRSVRVLGRAGARVLTAGRARYAGIVIVLGLAAAAVTSVAVQRIGEWLTSHMSLGLVVSGTVAADDVLLAVALFVVVIASPFVARGVAGVADARPTLRAFCDPPGAVCILALGIAVDLLVRLPLTYAAAPSSVCFGLVVGISASRAVYSRIGTRAYAGLLGVAVIGAIAGAKLLPRIAPEAQLAVVARAPYASLLVGAVRQITDRDHDGYSPVLLGGDCNDHDASVNPAARDIPGNGIDENCSGADAQPYRPLVPPPSPRPASLPPRANIVMIQLDALRPDHVGFVGYKRQTTRNLDVFRESATFFARAYSPMPSTRFAIAAVFTGKDGVAVPQRYAGGPDYTLLPEAETVAERLAEAGYDRFGLTISYVMQHIHGVDQGFQEFRTPWPVDQWAKTYPQSATLTTDAALAHLSGIDGAKGTTPYFMFVHYQCTHDPYAAQPEWPFGNDPIDRYDSAAAYCDHEVGRLLRALDARPDRASTALVVFSDHGELFGEHGLTAHGNSVYEPDARSLLLVRLPGGRSVATVDQEITLTDLAPTILELAGIAPKPDTDPWSLVPYATAGAARRPSRQIYLGADLWRGPMHYLANGVVDGRYKLVRDLIGHSDELFDLDQDPREETNLVPVLPDLHGHLEELVEAHGARGSVF